MIQHNATPPHDPAALAAAAFDLWQQQWELLRNEPTTAPFLQGMLEQFGNVMAGGITQHELWRGANHGAPSTNPPLSSVGPTPLPLHLGLAHLMWLNWPLLWHSLQPALNNSSNSSPPALPLVWSQHLHAPAARLAAASATLPPEIWQRALAAEGMARYRDYLAGVSCYRQQAVTVSTAMPAPALLWQSGSSRLLDYAPQLTNAPMVLVIPSLINRATILDLSPDESLLRWLAAQGIKPFLLDWGVPADHEHGLTISDYVQRCQTAVQHIQHHWPQLKLHVLGHCLGGNVAVAVAALHPATFASVVLLSTPWDFHSGNPQLGQQAQALWQHIAPLLSPNSLLPASIMPSLFALLQPVAVTQKFRAIITHPPDPDAMARFVRVEQWLNDPVPLPIAIMREIVQDWYGANLPLLGAWRVGEALIKPCHLTMPLLLVVPERDHIVPPTAALALARYVPQAETLTMALGHVGLIISRRAKSLVWERLAKWLKA